MRINPIEEIHINSNQNGGGYPSSINPIFSLKFLFIKTFCTVHIVANKLKKNDSFATFISAIAPTITVAFEF